ncbi:hypothetical protein CMQ_7430 [Grosmannia clavigera kw1407]|uniref:Uncharacterized protein n=1 Tax=Grosmannia clavigera (strain kw1407 / UAMH 11150) TaxID=655863 RepID=F0XP72_GROCL|nr:uncharacterized protein CMQ_7430 [Grosmannia clavigera kw1407]EFX00428.1 hypothetical protein CMQ_7430 [Grosmannia clavigera kw1407]
MSSTETSQYAAQAMSGAGAAAAAAARNLGPGMPVAMPNLSGQPNGLVGNLLKGPIDANGKLKDAALMVGIKLDLEAEVHLTARVRGDILVGLY